MCAINVKTSIPQFSIDKHHFSVTFHMSYIAICNVFSPKTLTFYTELYLYQRGELSFIIYVQLSL